MFTLVKVKCKMNDCIHFETISESYGRCGRSEIKIISYDDFIILNPLQQQAVCSEYSTKGYQDEEEW